MRVKTFTLLFCFFFYSSFPANLYGEEAENNTCELSSSDKINQLLYATINPYVPSVDRQGNPLLGPEEAYFEKAQHCTNQYFRLKILVFKALYKDLNP